MDDYNKRSAEMWDFIKVSHSFKDRQVVDLGCGHGDFIWRAYNEGAIYVLGIDDNLDAVKDAIKRCVHHGVPTTVSYQRVEDLLDHATSNAFTYYDVTFCFSVLPYLALTIHEAVEMISNVSPVAFFEFQYIGDGPGKELRDDVDAMLFLSQYYDDVDKVGWTQAKPIHARTIWRCRSGGRYR